MSALVSASARDGLDQRPLIAHIVYRLAMGGLENGLVNLINGLPAERYRHAVICLDGYTEFAERIQRAEVGLYALNKPPGFGLGTQVRLWRLLRRLQPDIVHSRNLAALECQVASALSGVPVRVHGEHGRDVSDLDGSSIKYRRIRKAFSPWVHHYVALSHDLARYLSDGVGIAPDRITQLYNGVDTERFRPGRRVLPEEGFDDPGLFVVGTVGRMQPVKDQLTLAHAFIELLRRRPEERTRLRLVMVGDGPLREKVEARLTEAGVRDHAWLAGDRNDVPALLQGMDVFVLPSLAEGICNTVLEAMATGLPVVATDVGGNPELVEEGRTGTLVPAGDAGALADAIDRLRGDDEGRRALGERARSRVEESFSLAAMIKAYGSIYDRLLSERGRSLVEG